MSRMDDGRVQLRVGVQDQTAPREVSPSPRVQTLTLFSFKLQ